MDVTEDSVARNVTKTALKLAVYSSLSGLAFWLGSTIAENKESPVESISVGVAGFLVFYTVLYGCSRYLCGIKEDSAEDQSIALNESGFERVRFHEDRNTLCDQLVNVLGACGLVVYFSMMSGAFVGMLNAVLGYYIVKPIFPEIKLSDMTNAGFFGYFVLTFLIGVIKVIAKKMPSCNEYKLLPTRDHDEYQAIDQEDDQDYQGGEQEGMVPFLIESYEEDRETVSLIYGQSRTRVIAYFNWLFGGGDGSGQNSAIRQAVYDGHPSSMDL
ncbi:MAG: hypothetical protein ACE365_04250 [Gammaproteobacteria bacterium]